MEEIEKVASGTTKRFVICRRRMGGGNPEGPRRELVDETDLFSQAESLPALFAAERAVRAVGTALRAPEASCYETLCARTGEIVACYDAGEAPAWALEPRRPVRDAVGGPEVRLEGSEGRRRIASTTSSTALAARRSTPREASSPSLAGRREDPILAGDRVVRPPRPDRPLPKVRAKPEAGRRRDIRRRHGPHSPKGETP